MRRISYSLAYLILLGLPAATMLIYVGSAINWRGLALTVLLVLLVGGIFDIWATRQSRRDEFFIWEYNSRSILGFKLYGVPIEDYAFFLVLTPCFIIGLYETVVSTEIMNTYSAGFLIILAGIIAYGSVYHSAIREKRR